MQSENYKITYILNKVADLVIVSVLWCLCSLPVITIGASTSALYYAVVKSVKEDKSYVVSSFWAALKMNLKQGTAVGFVALICLITFGSTAFVMYQFSGNFIANAYFVFSILCFCISIIAQLHAFFLIGRFHIRGKEFGAVLLKLCIREIGNNFLMLCVFIFAVELTLYYPIFIVFAPAGAVFLMSYAEEKRFAKYIKM